MSLVSERGAGLVRGLMLLVGVALCVVGLLALAAGEELGVVVALIGLIVGVITWAAKPSD